MKTSTRTAMALSFLLGLFPVLTAKAGILSLSHKSITLPNGLRVYLVKFPSPGVVAYQLPVRVGSRNEIEKGKSGFAHFFEHLMFRGTKNRSAKEFGELYVKLGVENNAWTWFDMTNYHGISSVEYLPKILDAEADRFMNLHFDEKALRDEAGAVLGEYNKSISDPDFVMEEKLQATAFKVHPYGHTTLGYKEDILKYTERYADVWPFFKRYYRPSNVSVVLVGDIEFDEAIKTVESEFGKWKDPDTPAQEIPQEPEQKEARNTEIKLDNPMQTRVSIAFKVPAFTTKNTDFAALQLLAEIYFSVTSDFQKEYRYNRKWLDTVSATPIQSIDPGLWTIYLRLSEAGEGKEKEILKAIHDVINEIKTKGPSAERLVNTKKRFRNEALSSWFSSPEALAGRIAWLTNFEPDLGILDRLFQRLEEVKSVDLSSFAKRYLIESRKTTIIMHGSQ